LYKRCSRMRLTSWSDLWHDFDENNREDGDYSGEE
jgi:hypothetical protein